MKTIAEEEAEDDIEIKTNPKKMFEHIVATQCKPKIIYTVKEKQIYMEQLTKI